MQRFIEWLSFPAFLVFFLPLVACGGSSATNSMTLKVAQNSNSYSYFPLYVAEVKGFFQAQKLTLDPSTPPQLGTGTKMTAAVEANNVELAAGVITDAFSLSTVNSSIKILGTITTGLGSDIVVSKQFEQQTGLTAQSPLAEKVKALVGKKIGVTSIGAATDAFLVYLFKQQGLGDVHKQATVVNMGGSNVLAGLAALRAGRVDALSFPPPTGAQAELEGAGDWFIGGKDLPLLQKAVGCVLYAKQNVIDAKPKAMQAFIRALAQAEAWIQKNPDQARVLLGQYLHYDRKTVDALAPTIMPTFPSSPQVSQAGYKTTNDFLTQGRLISVPLLYSDLVATSTINDALSEPASPSQQ